MYPSTPSNRPLASNGWPSEPAARRDHIDRAMASLDDEARRVERLGLENPQVRVSEERRYWAFLAAVHAVTNPDSPVLSRELANWLAGNSEPKAELPGDSRWS